MARVELPGQNDVVQHSQQFMYDLVDRIRSDVHFHYTIWEGLFPIQASNSKWKATSHLIISMLDFAIQATPICNTAKQVLAAVVGKAVADSIAAMTTQCEASTCSELILLDAACRQWQAEILKGDMPLLCEDQSRDDFSLRELDRIRNVLLKEHISQIGGYFYRMSCYRWYKAGNDSAQLARQGVDYMRRVPEQLCCKLEEALRNAPKAFWQMASYNGYDAGGCAFWRGHRVACAGGTYRMQAQRLYDNSPPT
mmetsp:Transcript_62770/g.147199  ORF Transcript_62770/g.147199 Transcript_62770/m.147199 type:complete len:253 (+) Transcript_62770:45-803(+)